MNLTGYIAMYTFDTKREYRVGNLRMFSRFGGNLTLDRKHHDDGLVSVVVGRRVYRHILEDLFDGTYVHTCAFFVKPKYEEHLSLLRANSPEGVVFQFYPVYGWDMVHEHLHARMMREIDIVEGAILKLKGKKSPAAKSVNHINKRIDHIFEQAKLIAEYTGNEPKYLGPVNGLKIMLDNVLNKKEEIDEVNNNHDGLQIL